MLPKKLNNKMENFAIGFNDSNAQKQINIANEIFKNKNMGK